MSADARNQLWKIAVLLSQTDAGTGDNCDVTDIRETDVVIDELTALYR